MTLGLISLGLLFWIHRSLGMNFSNSPDVHHGNTLIRSGPYRRVRHPIYSTMLLHWVAILLLTLNFLFGGLFLVAQWITVRRRVPQEEANLRRAFGEPYEAYAATTGRFLPRTSR